MAPIRRGGTIGGKYVKMWGIASGETPGGQKYGSKIEQGIKIYQHPWISHQDPTSESTAWIVVAGRLQPAVRPRDVYASAEESIFNSLQTRICIAHVKLGQCIP